MRPAVIWLAVAVPLLGGCLSEKAQLLKEFETAPLFGMVYDQDNRPCPGARITVDGDDGPTTDIDGRFIVQELARGEHTLAVSRAGYERLELVMEFIDRTQVLYLKVTSAEQLHALAESALDQRRLDEADRFLRRAEIVDPADPVAQFLRAVLFLKRREPGEAARVLEGLIAAGHREPAVHLALADLYQYDLREPSRAAPHLREYLRLRDDRAAAGRLEELTAPTAAPARE